jgi:flagellar hook-associated protein 3 FlgL
MTRISTLGQQQSLITQMLKGQVQAAETQRQVATGNKASTYAGIARETAALISARALESRTAQFVETGKQVSAQVDLQNVNLSAVYDAAKSLRDSLLSALANNSGRTVKVDLENAFASSKAALNNRVGGRYLFAGSLTDVQPFSAADLSALSVVAAPIEDFFQNNSQKAQVRLEQNQVIEYGLLADDIGKDLMASIKRIAEYDNATPIGQYLTPADQAALQAEVTALDAAMDNITRLQAANGFLGERIESVTKRNEELITVNKQLIADISEVDMAEAISRLNQDKLSVEASYNLVRQLSQLSLLNFLR